MATEERGHSFSSVIQMLRRVVLQRQRGAAIHHGRQGVAPPDAGQAAYGMMRGCFVTSQAGAMFPIPFSLSVSGA